MEQIEYTHYVNRFLQPLWERGGLRNLVTCNGLFQLEQCEIAPRFLDGTMLRDTRYTTDKQFIDEMKRIVPHGIQLGASRLPNADTLSEARAIASSTCETAMGPFVLDIDITDYDRSTICKCGPRDPVCQTCWDAIMEPARAMTMHLLVDTFGFKRVLEVFSGKKGVHFWVYDERAVRWTHRQRCTFMANICQIQGCPRFDTQVSTRAEHLKGLPLTIHHETCYFRIPLERGKPFNLKEGRKKPSWISLQQIPPITWNK